MRKSNMRLDPTEKRISKQKDRLEEIIDQKKLQKKNAKLRITAKKKINRSNEIEFTVRKPKLDLVAATEGKNAQNEQKEILSENLTILRTDER